MTSQKLLDYIGKRYSLGLHERWCEMVGGTKVPTNPLTGETYDVYIIPHCNCWVAEAHDSIEWERASRILLDISHWNGYVQHDPKCARLYPEDIIYRGRREKLWKNCNCWITDWKGEE